MSRLYIAKAPSFSSVEVFVASLILPRGAKAFLQALKAKCRELARADSSILVAPTAEALTAPFGGTLQLSLWILAKDGYVSNPKFQEKLQKLDVKLNHRVSTSRGILQACYQFTLIARLAPKWNQVTNWLIKGGDFLTTGKGHALSLDIGITDSEITMTLLVQKLSFSFLKPEDLNVTATTLHRFQTDPHFLIGETSIYSNRCLLLPNFTVGYIFSASHQVPCSPEFPTYDKLRLHWKKQHGIILPEKQDLFYQVFFKSNPGNFFSYPGCCIFKSYPLVFPGRDTDAVAAAFVADVHARMPSICGEPVRFSSKALIPFAQLSSAGSLGPHPNIKPAAPMKSQPQNWRRVPVTTTTTVKSQAKTPVSINSCSDMTGSSSYHQTLQQSQLVPTSKGYSHGGHIHTSAQSDSVTTVQVCQAALHTPIVPIFKPIVQPRKATTAGCLQSSHSRLSKASIVPTFKSKVSSATQPSFTKPQTASAIQVKKAHPKPSTQRQVNMSEMPPAKRPCLTPSSVSIATASASTIRTVSSLQQPVSSSSVISQQAMIALGSGHQVVPDLSGSLALPCPEDGTSINDSTHKSGKTTTGTAMLTNISNGTHQPPPKKTATGEPKILKKSESLKVEGVSENIIKKILKTKAPLLKKWLQENGVKCRSKDRKEELARLAALHIRETGKVFEVTA